MPTFYHALPAWRPVCAAALMSGVLSGTWSPASHAASLATEAVLAAPVPVSAKKVITHDVYANWRSVQGSILSRDGLWAAYALTAQEGDGEVVFRHLKDGREYRSPRGAAPLFSADGKFAAFAVRPTRVEQDKAKKEKKKPEDAPKSGLGIIDLQSGKIELIERVKQYAWSEEGGGWLAVLMEAAPDAKKDAKKDSAENKKDLEEDQVARAAAAGAMGAAAKKKESGSELLLIDVANKQRISIKDVGEMVWAKNGVALAYTLKPVAKDSKDNKDSKEPAKETNKEVNKEASKESTKEAAELAAKEGVYLFTPVDQQQLQIFSGTGSIKHLRFDEDGKQLAFLSNRDDLTKRRGEEEKKPKKAPASDAAAEKEDPPLYQLYYWKKGEHHAALLASAATPGMPEKWGVSEFGELGFSKDGQRLFFGTAEIQKAEPKDAPEPVKVDLWHWKDPELQSVQKVRAEKDKQKNYKAVIHLAEQRFVQLGNAHIPAVSVNDNPDFAMGSSDVPYKMLLSWDGAYRDVYAIDLKTGQSRLLAQKQRFVAGMSPAGKYVLGFDAKHYSWQAWSTADGKQINLTGKIKARFEDHEHDTPQPRSPYGYAGWTEGDRSVVLYDQFDLWEVTPATLASRNLSQGYGRAHQLQLRYINLENTRPEIMEEPTPVAESKPLAQGDWLLSALNENTRASGFYQMSANGAQPQQRVFGDQWYGGVIKAKKADTVLFTRQSFTEFPDVWASDVTLNAPQKISQANPQQAQYNWGTQEIIEYSTTDGRKLKALLAKPENFDPAKKYPMMVYIYEKMSDNLHRHTAPAPSQNINVTRYLSNGYIVLRPDITYTTGHPGRSALQAVTGAVNKVVGMGFVDPKRVGIQGHSWGAYQINYLITRTNMFAAAEAGASMANMTSGYGGIRWGAGVSRAFQYETGQSRMGGTPWNKTAEYIENSPLFQIDKVKTPYLTKHNDEDDAVPWYQAIEFFTALRRLGKEAYWFNYNGEKHGLRDRENVKHYTVHMAEFFDHFLLGAARPGWMEKPIPYLERGKRDVTPLFKPAEEKGIEAKAIQPAKVEENKSAAAVAN
ncbi:alpha/beta hydrolase family protein [Undibacterium rugosum]|uniref:alpha/beta hydrolase family protein n=1 Tax=Undibacterium rugosum TaxID=2762291 RepID=UPI001B83F700|nr:prolyl oligopeptidase family serine peptidase [Undibacterium rugosum]MBR7779785.1 S9 family peptidase [Undibacterium rugosum]